VRVLNGRGLEEIPANAVWVDRSTKWGNPFVIGRDGNRKEVLEKYAVYLALHPLALDIRELVGKDLVCWCAPLPCHAEILAEACSAWDTPF
jgi:hypothetical protein